MSDPLDLDGLIEENKKLRRAMMKLLLRTAVQECDDVGYHESDPDQVLADTAWAENEAAP